MARGVNIRQTLGALRSLGNLNRQLREQKEREEEAEKARKNAMRGAQLRQLGTAAGVAGGLYLTGGSPQGAALGAQVGSTLAGQHAASKGYEKSNPNELITTGLQVASFAQGREDKIAAKEANKEQLQPTLSSATRVLESQKTEIPPDADPRIFGAEIAENRKIDAKITRLKSMQDRGLIKPAAFQKMALAEVGGPQVDFVTEEDLLVRREINPITGAIDDKVVRDEAKLALNQKRLDIQGRMETNRAAAEENRYTLQVAQGEERKAALARANQLRVEANKLAKDNNRIREKLGLAQIKAASDKVTTTDKAKNLKIFDPVKHKDTVRKRLSEELELEGRSPTQTEVDIETIKDYDLALESGTVKNKEELTKLRDKLLVDVRARRSAPVSKAIDSTLTQMAASNPVGAKQNIVALKQEIIADPYLNKEALLFKLDQLETIVDASLEKNRGVRNANNRGVSTQLEGAALAEQGNQLFSLDTPAPGNTISTPLVNPLTAKADVR